MLNQQRSGVVKKNVVLLAIAALSGLLGSAHRAFAEGPGWIFNVTVTALVNTANGGFNVRVSPGLSGCVSQSGYGAGYASVYASHPGISRIKADLLVAFVTGAPVSLYFSDSSCTVSEMVLGTY
jgi:hypothetical protein